jgi:hypothetical protein
MPGVHRMPVDAFLLIALTSALSLGSAALIVSMDRRAACLPRPDDATVTAMTTALDWPTEGQVVIMVGIANPGSVPVLVGLLLHRQLLPGGRARATVAYRTTKPRYQAGKQATVAAVPGGALSRLSVPVPDTHRRYRLEIMIGQPDRRLQVISAPVTIARA